MCILICLIIKNQSISTSPVLVRKSSLREIYEGQQLFVEASVLTLAISSVFLSLYTFGNPKICEEEIYSVRHDMRNCLAPSCYYCQRFIADWQIPIKANSTT